MQVFLHFIPPISGLLGGGLLYLYLRKRFFYVSTHRKCNRCSSPQLTHATAVVHDGDGWDWGAFDAYKRNSNDYTNRKS